MASDTAPVSVVIPCYRAEATLARALDSVRRQTWPPGEVIVVDDGSPDASFARVRRVVQESGIGGIRLLRRATNGGPGAARNTGWAAAAQPLVAFLDADDSWHPRKVEIQARYMLRYPEVSMSGHRWRTGGAEEGPGGYEPPEEPEVAALSFDQLLWRNVLATPTVMVRRTLPLRFDERKRYSEDYLLWLLVLAHGFRAAFLDAELTCLHKAPFGEGGLSAHLWAMEVGELDAYWQLYRHGWITAGRFMVLVTWSLIKFARRVGRVGMTRWPLARTWPSRAHGR